MVAEIQVDDTHLFMLAPAASSSAVSPWWQDGQEQ